MKWINAAVTSPNTPGTYHVMYKGIEQVAHYGANKIWGLKYNGAIVKETEQLIWMSHEVIREFTETEVRGYLEKSEDIFQLINLLNTRPDKP